MAPMLVEDMPIKGFNMINGGVVIDAKPYFPEAKQDESKEVFSLEVKNEEKATEQTVEATVIATAEKKEEELQLIIKNEVKVQEEEIPVAVKIGERVLSDDELAERKRFEEQKRALEERAERLRRMSFNIKAGESTDDLENVPAYVRKNVEITDSKASTDTSYYSGYSVGVNQQPGNQASIQTINTFLDGKKPD
jgi:cell division protein FtsZ